MKKLLYMLIAIMVIVMLPSCRGAAGKKASKKAVQLVEEYGGKFFNKAKKLEINKYGDDVLRLVEFVEVPCDDCKGKGGTWLGTTCEKCGGDGIVYTIKFKQESLNKSIHNPR